MATRKKEAPPADRPAPVLLVYTGPDETYRNPRRGVDKATKGEPFEASALALKHLNYLHHQGFERA